MENFTTQVRYNSMNITSFSSFMNIKGSVRNGCKDVYFIRCIGHSPAFLEELAHMDQVMAERERNGMGGYQRIQALPVLNQPEEIAFYRTACQRWMQTTPQTVRVKSTRENIRLETRIGLALAQTVEQFQACTEHSNATITENFILKLLFWLDHTAGPFWLDWDENKTNKLICNGITKKQEYLFLYFLTAIGIDVLILSPAGELPLEERLLSLSGRLTMDQFTELSIPPCQNGSDYNNRQTAAAKESSVAQQTAAAKEASAARQPAAAKESSAAQQTAAAKESSAARQTAAAESASQSANQGHTPIVRIPRERTRKNTAQTASTAATASTAPAMSAIPTMPTAAANRSPGPNQEAERAIQAAGRGVSITHPNRSGGHGLVPTRCEKTYEELALCASSMVMIEIHNQMGKLVGTGSGIMINQDGCLLTNNHVTQGGAYYSVRIEDDENLYETDELIKCNAHFDLSIIRISRRCRPIPIYRGGEKLVRGQRVVAIGSPLGMFNTVSDGIISGFRTIDYVDMIQFTAPISHGSSGGALLNMYGEVIGISTAGFDSGQNLNLAVHYQYLNDFVRGFVS